MSFLAYFPNIGPDSLLMAQKAQEVAKYRPVVGLFILGILQLRPIFWDVGLGFKRRPNILEVTLS